MLESDCERPPTDAGVSCGLVQENGEGSVHCGRSVKSDAADTMGGVSAGMELHNTKKQLCNEDNKLHNSNGTLRKDLDDLHLSCVSGGVKQEHLTTPPPKYPPSCPTSKGLPSSTDATPKMCQDDLRSELRRYINVEVHPNGGASVVHMHWNQIQDLPPEHLELLVDEYFEETFREDSPGVATHVMSIVHGAARYLPELLGYLRDQHSSVVVQVGSLTKGAKVTTTTLGEYGDEVEATYAEGTYRSGPLNHISLVGTVSEETGGYFEDLITLLEQSPVLARSLPWGCLSQLELSQPTESDDGPILWARPGEQLIPLGEGRDSGSGWKRKT